ncbi:MAG TPA: TPM domain-containing protein, partial [Candidatus Polarisedimenticolia bacterium]|nr:TPM domain-containing protein [Candidatus Polarisedimenticolia bacterium]
MRTAPSRLAACLLAASLAAVISIQAGVKIPARTDHPVHDYAKVIIREDQRKMEDLSRELLEKARVSLIVVTISSLEGEPIEDLTVRWLREWGIGDKETNRGILVLVAVGDRKVRIENGYGVEGYLPDGLVGEIIDEEALPYYKRGDYSVGTLRMVERLALLTAQEYGFELSGEVSSRLRPTIITGVGKLLLILLLFLLVVGGLPLIMRLLLLGAGGRSGRGRGRGGWHTGGGGFTGFGG